MANETYGTTTIINDVGSDANSYASVAEIKAQWDKNPNIDYSLLDDETIARFAIASTQSLDLQYGENYAGTLYNKDYALFWPRVGVFDRRGVLIDDYTVFPSDLIGATAAQAWWLNSVDLLSIEISGGGASGTKRKSMDGLGELEYFDVTDQMIASRRPQVSSEAKGWLSSFVLGGTSAYVQVMYRG